MFGDILICRMTHFGIHLLSGAINFIFQISDEIWGLMEVTAYLIHGHFHRSVHFALLTSSFQNSSGNVKRK